MCNVRTAFNYKTGTEFVLRRMRVTPMGLCLRVIVDEKPQDLDKKTSSILFVLLLIYSLTQNFGNSNEFIECRLLNLLIMECDRYDF